MKKFALLLVLLASIAQGQLQVTPRMPTATAIANDFVTAISPAGVVTQARPTCGNLSDSVASCSTDATNATNITSGTLPAPRLGANGVANSQLAQMATLTIKGNNTGGASDPQDLTVSQVNTMLGTLTNPMTTGGDIIYGGASGTPTRLANGTANAILTSAGSTSAPTWIARAFYSGYLLSAGANWTTTSSTYADFGNQASNTLTDIISVNMGSAAILTGTKPGITLTLPTTAYYEVSAVIEAFASVTASYSLRLVDGSGTVINPGVSVSDPTGNYGPVTLTGLYSGTAGSTSFKIQGATNTSTLNVGNGQASGTPAATFTVKLLR